MSFRSISFFARRTNKTSVCKNMKNIDIFKVSRIELTPIIQTRKFSRTALAANAQGQTKV